MTSGFSRCHKCHGYSIHGEIPSHALCKACRRYSDTVCAACLNGFHSMTQCGLGTGVNKEYFPESSELFPVCPDCMWEWVQFFSMNPNKTFAVHQAEAITVMRANARSSSRMYGTSKDFLKQFIQSNRVPKGSLIRALQAQRGLKCGAATNAADKIEELITSGHIEVRYCKCYWNDIPSPRVPPGGVPDPPTNRACESMKRSYFLVQ